MLGSDGLFDFVGLQRIAYLVDVAGSPDEACDLLIGEALHTGSGDNITVTCIHLV